MFDLKFCLQLAHHYIHSWKCQETYSLLPASVGWGKVIVSVCYSLSQWEGGTYPAQVQGTTPQPRYLPLSRWGWGRGYPRYLPPGQGTYPLGQVRTGEGVPQGTYPTSQVRMRGGVPKVPPPSQVRMRGGVPQGTYPPGQGTYSLPHQGTYPPSPRQGLATRRGGMPLAFTQEDFLLFISFGCVPKENSSLSFDPWRGQCLPYLINTFTANWPYRWGKSDHNTKFQIICESG